jgi:hypothetical protein
VRDNLRGGVVTARTNTSRAETVAAAAPDPARPAVTVSGRTRAIAVMIASVGALATLGSFALRHRGDAGALVPPPFQLKEPTWRAVLTVASVSNRSCPASAPIVLLYVSSTCAHCKVELERWSKLVRTQSPRLSCIGIAVIASPNGATPSASWLPAELSPSLLWDHDHDIARELGVRLVPLAAFVTPKGVVTSESVGEASEESTDRRLEELRQVANTSNGVKKK